MNFHQQLKIVKCVLTLDFIFSCSSLQRLQTKLKKGDFDDDDDDVMIVDDLPATPETQKEISVKIRSRSGIQRFSIKKVCVLNTVEPALSGH